MIAAGIAGALLIAADKALLTAGVMVGLSLVPGVSIAAMALVVGEWCAGSRRAGTLDDGCLHPARRVAAGLRLEAVSDP
jgi:hypothetical protein